MKKIYEKPVVIIENFALCENIALGCERKANQTVDQCGYEDESGMILFTSELNVCDTSEQYGEQICYHVPSADLNLFTS